ncbi:MAG TPA: serine/threonine-protein kinase [Polyangiaceae bacterium]
MGNQSGLRAVPRGFASMVGMVIDERYEVVQLLGEGGMGCVYRVRHRVLERSFALKVLRPEFARDVALAERFVQEARAAAAIVHPNVVSITDFGMFGTGQPYFVMELLVGRTLSSTLRERGSLRAEEVVVLAKAVASALSSAHQVGVIHRDLKPDNVILLGGTIASTSLKVLDFGLAMLLGSSRLTQDSVVYGTPQYMSPEQAAGETIDSRVDIYALGILMYEMLSGRVPFQADSYMGVLTKQLYAEPEPLLSTIADSKFGELLCAVVMRCLEKDREARFSSMHDVIAALDAIDIAAVSASGGEDPSAVPVSARGPMQSHYTRRTKRGWRWWLFAVVGTVALGSALGLLFGRLLARVHSGPILEGQGSSTIGPGDHPFERRSDLPVDLQNRPHLSGLAAPGAPRKPTTHGISQRKSASDLGRLADSPLRPNPSSSESPDDLPTTNSPRTPTGSSELADPWAK